MLESKEKVTKRTIMERKYNWITGLGTEKFF